MSWAILLSIPETKKLSPFMIYMDKKDWDAGWEVVERKRTQAERKKEERRLQQRTNPKGSISVGIDATDLFDHFDIF